GDVVALGRGEREFEAGDDPDPEDRAVAHVGLEQELEDVVAEAPRVAKAGTVRTAREGAPTPRPVLLEDVGGNRPRARERRSRPGIADPDRAGAHRSSDREAE